MQCPDTLDDSNYVRWNLPCADTILKITNIRDCEFEFELESPPDCQALLGRAPTCEPAVTQALQTLDAIRDTLSAFREQYAPVTLKDGLIDVWYTTPTGEEVEDTCEVPWSTCQLGGAAVRAHMDTVSQELEQQGNTAFGYTQTW